MPLQFRLQMGSNKFHQCQFVPSKYVTRNLLQALVYRRSVWSVTYIWFVESCATVHASYSCSYLVGVCGFLKSINFICYLLERRSTKSMYSKYA